MILQDIYRVIKNNSFNAITLNNYYEFKFWLLDLVLEAEFIENNMENEENCNEINYEVIQKIKTLVL